MNKDIYPDELAERLSERAGDPYQPSNGTEGDIFMCRYCANCRHSEPEFIGCEIQLLTMVHDTDDAEYPKQWTYNENGQPTCTAFEEVRESE